MSSSDDDAPGEFDDDLPTLETPLAAIEDEDVFPGVPVGPALPDTGPHRSIEWLAGRKVGYDDGINAACALLAGELRRLGIADAEIPKVALRLRRGAAERG